MAELIFPKFGPSLAGDQSTTANCPPLGDGSWPAIAAIEPELVPGMWHVEIRNHGLSLGAIADRFATREEAEQWVADSYGRNPGRTGSGRYLPRIVYTPTVEELGELEQAPNFLDLVVYVVKIPSAPPGEALAEFWASEEEAKQRVDLFRDQGLGATLCGPMFFEYEPTTEDLKRREETLKIIRGNSSKLSDGSIWETTQWSAFKRHDSSGWNRLAPNRWQLIVYKLRESRDIQSDFNSAAALVSTSEILSDFSCEQAAWAEGLQILAVKPEFVAVSVWHADLPLGQTSNNETTT